MSTTTSQVTVKRVPGGAVSNWMVDSLAPGDGVESTCPAGVFCLGTGGGAVVAFAAGSGITPVYSIVKTALATTSRPVRLLYANRDREAVIFDEGLTRLAGEHPGRLQVLHHLDLEKGFVDDEAARRFAGDDPVDAEYLRLRAGAVHGDRRACADRSRASTGTGSASNASCRPSRIRLRRSRRLPPARPT